MKNILNKEDIKRHLIEIGYYIIKRWGHTLEYGTFSSIEVDKILFAPSRKRIKSSAYITNPIKLENLLSQSDLSLSNCFTVTTEEEEITIPLDSFFYFFNTLEKIAGVKPKDRMKWVKKPEGEIITTGEILFSPKESVKEQATLLFLKDKLLNCKINFQDGIIKLGSTCGFSFQSKVTICSESLCLTSLSCSLSKDKLKNMNGRCVFTIYKIKHKNNDFVIVLITNESGDIISLISNDNSLPKFEGISITVNKSKISKQDLLPVPYRNKVGIMIEGKQKEISAKIYYPDGKVVKRIVTPTTQKQVLPTLMASSYNKIPIKDIITTSYFPKPVVIEVVEVNREDIYKKLQPPTYKDLTFETWDDVKRSPYIKINDKEELSVILPIQFPYYKNSTIFERIIPIFRKVIEYEENKKIFGNKSCGERPSFYGHKIYNGSCREIVTAYDNLKDNEYMRIRTLTPAECLKFQGVPEIYLNKMLNSGVSDAQLHKQAGNSIVVDVLYNIFKNLLINPPLKDKPIELTAKEEIEEQNVLF